MKYFLIYKKFCFEEKLRSLDKKSMIFVFLILLSLLSFLSVYCRMPHGKNTRFNIAAFMKARKEARDEVLQANRNLAAVYKKVQRIKEKAS